MRINRLAIVAIIIFALTSCSNEVIKLSNQEQLDQLMQDVVENFGDEDITSVSINGMGDLSDQLESVSVSYKKDGVYYNQRFENGKFEDPVKSNAQDALDLSYKNIPSKKIKDFTFHNAVATFEKAVPEIKETFKNDANLTVGRITLHSLSRVVFKDGDYPIVMSVSLTVTEEKDSYYTVLITMNSDGTYSLRYD